MAVDPQLIHSANSADLEEIPTDFARRLWNETHQRFPESRARSDFARQVRDEEIVVPHP